MSFGKYKGKQVAWVLIEDPGYFAYLEREGANRDELIFAHELLKKLNQKPFVQSVVIVRIRQRIYLFTREEIISICYFVISVIHT